MQITGASVEILDLRHFAAPVLRPLLDAEGELWEQRLHWDYHASARLLMQYLDNHMLPGYAALETGQVKGYVFCVYEETKAVIGDVFALPATPDGANGGPGSAQATEETLLRHLFELLLNSPHVDRIESQLLLHPSGPAFRCLPCGRIPHLPQAFPGAGPGETMECAPGGFTRQSGDAPVARS